MGMCDCDCIENVICHAKDVLCTQKQYRYTQSTCDIGTLYSQANIMVRMLKIPYVK